MMYIQLSQNYRDYDRVKIIEAHFYEIPIKKLSFKYQICKKEGINFIELFSKTIFITDENIINAIENIVPIAGTKLSDSIHREFLQHIIDNDFELGSLELESE